MQERSPGIAPVGVSYRTFGHSCLAMGKTTTRSFQSSPGAAREVPTPSPTRDAPSSLGEFEQGSSYPATDGVARERAHNKLLTSRKQEGWSCHARREAAISSAERFPPAESHYSMEEMPGIIHFLKQLYLYSHCGHHPAPGMVLRWELNMFNPKS